MKVVLQQSEQDCLLACYAMILSHFRSPRATCAAGSRFPQTA